MEAVRAGNRPEMLLSRSVRIITCFPHVTERVTLLHEKSAKPRGLAEAIPLYNDLAYIIMLRWIFRLIALAIASKLAKRYFHARETRPRRV
jgi:hypothetical protein